MTRKQEIALEVDQLKQQLREREREREQNYELVPFGDGFCFDRCWFISVCRSPSKELS